MWQFIHPHTFPCVLSILAVLSTPFVPSPDSADEVCPISCRRGGYPHMTSAVLQATRTEGSVHDGPGVYMQFWNSLWMWVYSPSSPCGEAIATSSELMFAASSTNQGSFQTPDIENVVSILYEYHTRYITDAFCERWARIMEEKLDAAIPPGHRLKENCQAIISPRCFFKGCSGPVVPFGCCLWQTVDVGNTMWYLEDAEYDFSCYVLQPDTHTRLLPLTGLPGVKLIGFSNKHSCTERTSNYVMLGCSNTVDVERLVSLLYDYSVQYIVDALPERRARYQAEHQEPELTQGCAKSSACELDRFLMKAEMSRSIQNKPDVQLIGFSNGNAIDEDKIGHPMGPVTKILQPFFRGRFCSKYLWDSIMVLARHSLAISRKGLAPLEETEDSRIRGVSENEGVEELGLVKTIRAVLCCLSSTSSISLELLLTLYLTAFFLLPYLVEVIASWVIWPLVKASAAIVGNFLVMLGAGMLILLYYTLCCVVWTVIRLWNIGNATTGLVRNILSATICLVWNFGNAAKRLVWNIGNATKLFMWNIWKATRRLVIETVNIVALIPLFALMAVIDLAGTIGVTILHSCCCVLCALAMVGMAVCAICRAVKRIVFVVLAEVILPVVRQTLSLIYFYVTSVMLVLLLVSSWCWFLLVSAANFLQASVLLCAQLGKFALLHSARLVKTLVLVTVVHVQGYICWFWLFIYEVMRGCFLLGGAVKGKLVRWFRKKSDPEFYSDGSSWRNHYVQCRPPKTDFDPTFLQEELNEDDIDAKGLPRNSTHFLSGKDNMKAVTFGQMVAQGLNQELAWESDMVSYFDRAAMMESGLRVLPGEQASNRNDSDSWPILQRPVAVAVPGFVNTQSDCVLGTSPR